MGIMNQLTPLHGDYKPTFTPLGGHLAKLLKPILLCFLEAQCLLLCAKSELRNPLVAQKLRLEDRTSTPREAPVEIARDRGAHRSWV